MDDQDNKKVEEDSADVKDSTEKEEEIKTEEDSEETPVEEVEDIEKDEEKIVSPIADVKPEETTNTEANEEKEANDPADETPEDIQEKEDESSKESKPDEKKKESADDDSSSEEISEDIKRAKKLLSEDDPNDPAKWYIVHTYSGHENKVAKSIQQRVQSLGYEKKIFDIIVPTRNTIKVTQGKKDNVKEKIFPGYVLIKMVLDNEAWLLVRTTQGVTSFIGSGNKPLPISSQEVKAIMKFMEEEEPLYKATYSIGEAVKIVDGPFADFLGTIDNIDEAKGKLKVLVSIFGRETPVELDFLQVTKL